MSFLDCIERINRLDNLIRLEMTGSPKKMAENFDISERQVYRLIETMRDLGAQIEYSKIKESYIYLAPVKFRFGFDSLISHNQPSLVADKK